MKYEWLALVAFLTFASASADDQLQLVNYNNPGLVVDLGVGLSPWPVPMDADGDGDYDLVVSYDGKPSNGTYIFENTNGDTASNKFPVLKDGKWISRGYYDVTPSYVDGRVIVAVRNLEFPDFATTGRRSPREIRLLPASCGQWRGRSSHGASAFPAPPTIAANPQVLPREHIPSQPYLSSQDHRDHSQP